LAQIGFPELAKVSLFVGLALGLVALLLLQRTRQGNAARLQSGDLIVHLAGYRLPAVLLAVACVALSPPFLLWAEQVHPVLEFDQRFKTTLFALSAVLPILAGMLVWNSRRPRPITIDQIGIACPHQWEPALRWADIASIRRLNAGAVAMLVFELRAPTPIQVNRTWHSGTRLAEDRQALYVQANLMRAPIEALLSAFQQRLSNHGL
jgi:hypothetical protein